MCSSDASVSQSVSLSVRQLVTLTYCLDTTQPVMMQFQSTLNWCQEQVSLYQVRKRYIIDLLSSSINSSLIKSTRSYCIHHEDRKNDCIELSGTDIRPAQRCCFWLAWVTHNQHFSYILRPHPAFETDEARPFTSGTHCGHYVNLVIWYLSNTATPACLWNSETGEDKLLILVLANVRLITSKWVT